MLHCKINYKQVEVKTPKLSLHLATNMSSSIREMVMMVFAMKKLTPDKKRSKIIKAKFNNFNCYQVVFSCCLYKFKKTVIYLVYIAVKPPPTLFPTTTKKINSNNQYSHISPCVISMTQGNHSEDDKLVIRHS